MALSQSSLNYLIAIQEFKLLVVIPISLGKAIDIAILNELLNTSSLSPLPPLVHESK
jgi:hypothetical protein